MARIARVVVPDLPHHVTRRGSRRQPVFFDVDVYRQLDGAARRHSSLGLLPDAQSRPPANYAHLA